MQRPTLHSLTLLAALAAAPAFAQNAHLLPAPAYAGLPDDPSAVIAQQAESLAREPGSTYKLTLATTSAPGLSVKIEQPTSAPIPLSIDDAIALGLQRNVRLLYDRANLRQVHGDTRGVLAAVEPNLRLTAQSNAEEINLAAMGFKPATLATFGLNPATFSTIVKVQTTSAQISASQVLFNLPDYELLRGARSEVQVINLNELSSEGDLILAAGTAYLKVLADQANLTNAQAQQRYAQTAFSQADQKFQAGVAVRLDSLRAQVDFQQRQQAAIAAQSTLAKDLIQLNRIIGLPASQPVTLTDAAPFAELAAMPLEAAKLTAFKHRKDYLSLLAQVDVTLRESRAVKYQRLPTLAFNGFYGILGQTTGLYHGVFAAEGSLNFTIFREAGQRGEQEVVDSQLLALHQRLADDRVAIDGQIRSSTLDVDSSAQLVKVSQSNVDLAQQELSDEHDRVAAGVDTNLPLIDAEASLTAAQANLVQALYQYNVAKLYLARNTGIIESRYRTYLGK
jgi:outer membrane protein TolC